jgi:Uma2 family endonuclease
MTTTTFDTENAMHGQKMTADMYLTMQRTTSREDYGKYELFNKTLRFMAGASLAHNKIATNLVTIFNMLFWQINSSNEIYQSDMKVISFLHHKNYFYPDVVIVDDEPRFSDTTKDVLINPSIIIEVLSDETEAFDRGDKYVSYRQIETLREYILVAQHERRIEHFYKANDGNWYAGSVVEDNGALTLLSIPIALPMGQVYRQVYV